MVCAKNTALAVAPNFYQNNNTFKEMIFPNKTINLHLEKESSKIQQA
jgi:hypothetical protein